MTQLTFSGGNISPLWSPDGRFIVFSGFDGAIWWIRSDGAGKPQLLIKGPNRMVPWSWSMDGKRVAYMEVSWRTAYDLWTAAIESDDSGLRAGKPEIFLQTPADERYPAFSPDGRWLAYVSNESGTNQVYVRAFTDENRPYKGGKWLISNTTSLLPHWSPAGHELFFRRASDNRIMVATYSATGDTFTPAKARVWSDRQIALWYNPAPDGKRVVALMRKETTEPKQQNRVTFLLNFGDELQRKAPLGN